jgi:O-antigen ligase
MFISYKGVKRWLAFASLPFILNTVILTASRSAVLGMIAAGAAVIGFAPKRQRIWVIGAAGLGLVLLLVLARNETFWERTSTLSTVNESEMDPSAASRLVLIRTGWAMAQDFPFGAGHRGFDVLSAKYVPEALLNVEGVRAAHSTFIAVLVDQGIPGFLLYVALHLWAVVQLIKIKRAARASDDVVLGMYCAAVAGSLAAYFVAGLFINLLKAEIGVWLVAMLVILDRLQATAAVTAETPQHAIAPPVASLGDEVFGTLMRPPVFGEESR